MGKKKTLIEAGNTFDDYARHHLGKTPPQMEKARRNMEMAEKCFNAAGETYIKPPEPSKMPDFRPVEADSEPSGPLGAFEDAKALLWYAHHSSDEIIPLRARDLALDDRIVLKTLVETGMATVDETSDLVGITTDGRAWLGVRPEGVLELPVEVAEVTGNIAESELVARYLEAKVLAIDTKIAQHKRPKHGGQMEWSESYQHTAIVLNEAAREMRMGLHIPVVHIDGRVIPYTEDRSTGVTHESALRLFFEDVYGRNVKAGWWTDIKTGLPKKRSVGELFMLMVTELAEAYEAYCNNAADDKLPDYPGVGVEIGDLLIRVADFCGALYAGNIVAFSETRNPGDAMFGEVCMIARHYEAIRKTPEAVGDAEIGELLPSHDVAIMVDKKLAYNATRADHKIENRLKEGGKQT